MIWQPWYSECPILTPVNSCNSPGQRADSQIQLVVLSGGGRQAKTRKPVRVIVHQKVNDFCAQLVQNTVSYKGSWFRRTRLPFQDVNQQNARTLVS